MKTFIGTKIIKAEPMTRAAYNEFRGWTLPSDENGEDEGYLVEYTDGGKPNVATHAGYVSWSPSDVFDKAYREIPDVGADLPPHQQRVVIEKAELDVKLEKLRAFSGTPIFAGLDIAEQQRLDAQAHAMSVYSGVLEQRIAAF